MGIGSGQVFVSDLATGGIGGTIGSGDGAAVSSAFAQNTAPSLSPTLLSNSTTIGGVASATAAAQGAGHGTANASAFAKTLNGAAAIARATANGASGTVTSVSINQSIAQASATAPVHSTDTVETRTASAAPAPSASLGAGLQAFSFVTVDPRDADVRAALSGNPGVSSNFNVGGKSTMLGLAAIGSAYPSDGSGIKETFTSTFNQTIDLSQLPNLQHLEIGLVDPTFTGSFDSLHFLMTENGATVVDDTFTSRAQAAAFFGDDTLDLGSLAGVSSDITLGFELDVTSHTIGDSFMAELVGGDTTPGSGISPIPEPRIVYLLAVGLAVLAGLRRRFRIESSL
jgi:hypothetical protein